METGEILKALIELAPAEQLKELRDCYEEEAKLLDLKAQVRREFVVRLNQRIEELEAKCEDS